MILRRALLLSLVLYCASLIGCASQEMIEHDCGMGQVDWSKPARLHGDVRLVWEVNPEQVKVHCPRGQNYGCAVVDESVARVWIADEQRPECAVRKLAHELRHGVGQRHD